MRLVMMLKGGLIYHLKFLVFYASPARALHHPGYLYAALLLFLVEFLRFLKNYYTLDLGLALKVESMNYIER